MRPTALLSPSVLNNSVLAILSRNRWFVLGIVAVIGSVGFLAYVAFGARERTTVIVQAPALPASSIDPSAVEPTATVSSTTSTANSGAAPPTNVATAAAVANSEPAKTSTPQMLAPTATPMPTQVPTPIPPTPTAADLARISAQTAKSLAAGAVFPSGRAFSQCVSGYPYEYSVTANYDGNGIWQVHLSPNIFGSPWVLVDERSSTARAVPASDPRQAC